MRCRQLIHGWLALSLLAVSACGNSQSNTGDPAASVQNSEVIDKSGPQVTLVTSKGDITLQLFEQAAPLSVENFMQYVATDFYDNTIFHRVIPNFMIQAGGHTEDMTLKETRGTIENEADNGLKNVRGSVAMARMRAPNSASAQFFINVVDNPGLDFREKTMNGYGYAVFGEVIDGMDVVDVIRGVSTGTNGPHRDVPVEPVFIEDVIVVNPETEENNS